jgi:hypothetical protein
MMGDRFVMQESLLYEFRLEAYVPADHMLRAIDRFVDLSDLAAASRAVLKLDGQTFRRSRTDDPDADHRLLFRDSFGTAPSDVGSIIWDPRSRRIFANAGRSHTPSGISMTSISRSMVA